MEIKNEHTSEPVSSIFHFSDLPDNPYTAHDEGRAGTIAKEAARSNDQRHRVKVAKAELKINKLIERAAE